MTYVLCAYGFALLGAGYVFIWTLGGRRAKTVLTLGFYRPRAAHRAAPHGARARRGHPNHRDRRIDVTALADLLTAAGPAHPPLGERSWWHDDYPTPGIDAAPTVTIPVTSLPPHLVRAEIDQPGAEHWGDLLSAMSTEERTVYSAEMVATYEATKGIERPFLEELDATMARFTADLERIGRRTEAAFVGVGANLLHGHGGSDRWSTGQFPLIEPAPALT